MLKQFWKHKINHTWSWCINFLYCCIIKTLSNLYLVFLIWSFKTFRMSWVIGVSLLFMVDLRDCTWIYANEVSDGVPLVSGWELAMLENQYVNILIFLFSIKYLCLNCVCSMFSQSKDVPAAPFHSLPRINSTSCGEKGRDNHPTVESCRDGSWVLTA